MSYGVVGGMWSWVVLFTPVAILFALACGLRVSERTWLAPAAFFALFWAAFTAVTVAQASILPVHPAALWMITGVVAAVGAGGLVAETFAYGPAPRLRSNQLTIQDLEWPVVKVVIVLTTASALGLVILFLVGLRLFDLDLTLDTLVLIGGRFSALRYGLNYSPPWQVRILAYWVYPAALIAGVGLGLARRRLHVAILLLPFVVNLLYGMLVSARSGIVMSVALGGSGFLATKVVSTGGAYRLFNRRFMTTVSLSVLLLFGTSLVAQWSRTGKVEGFDLSRFTEEAQTTGLGSVSVFSSWFTHVRTETPTLGRYTFAGPFALVGAGRELGIYTDMVALGEVGASNIFTAFRGLIEDFTVGGALLLAFLTGIVVTASFRLASRGSVVAAIPLSLFFAATLLSPLFSIFTFNSVVFAWVVPVGWVFWTGAGNRRRGPA